MSTNTNTNSIGVIYVELDVLLDTRLGTIAKINPDTAAAVLERGDYHTREEDVFEGIDTALFKEQYQQRDTTTLARSLVTEGIQLVRHLVGVLTEQTIVRPYQDGIKIVVNVYPYKLDGEEKDQIGRAIAAWMQGLAPVELVDIHPEHLTPLHCKTSYAMMLVYDYDSWMSLHAAAFEQVRLNEITMFVPALYFGKKPTAEELEQTVKEAAHPMRAIEMLASPLIDLKLIDVKFFSILQRNKNPAHASPS